MSGRRWKYVQLRLKCQATGMFGLIYGKVICVYVVRDCDGEQQATCLDNLREWVVYERFVLVVSCELPMTALAVVG